MIKQAIAATSFIWRTPEPTDYDFKEGAGNTDFSTIGNVANIWYNLDLSSIVPVGTKIVGVRVNIADATVGIDFGLRKNGQISTFQRFCIITQVANQPISKFGLVRVDSNRVIEFRCLTQKPSDIDLIHLLILGWQ